MDLTRPAGAAVPGAPERAAAAGELRISRYALLIMGIAVAAAALRFATLGSQSFWFDEAQAVHEMRLSFGSMLHAWSVGEPNPPLYFVIAWPWARVFGTGEVGLRSLSAVLGVAAVPLVYLCGRELVSRRAGAFAAAFAALNPFLVWYSQEAREYMLLTVLCAASLLFFARAWRGGLKEPRRDLVWWAVVSGLALLTQYFAGFLVAAEGLLLLYRLRSRAAVLALAAMAAVEAATIPHLLGHISHPSQWIASVGPLAVRARQVPVTFALGTLYRGAGALTWSLLGAALLAVVVIGLLVAAADGREMRGAGLAAGLAAVVIVVPLVLGVARHDYYEARALIPAWVPLAIVVGAACAAWRAPGAAVAGGALALLLCAAFVWADVKIETGPAAFRRPDWRGVATALGPAHGTRAIAAFDGTFATAPLAVYLRGVPWTGGGQVPQTSPAPAVVDEVDVVGNVGETAAGAPPDGARLVSQRAVDGGYLVERFALPAPTPMTRADAAAFAARVTGSSASPSVLVQYGPSR